MCQIQQETETVTASAPRTTHSMAPVILPDEVKQFVADVR